MAQEKLRDVAARLHDILTEENICLRSARVGDAVSLSTKKADAAASFEALLTRSRAETLTARDKEIIEKISALAEENAAHLTAARNGIRSLIDRLSATNSDSFVGAYSRFGDRIPFTGATGNYTEKA